MKKNPYISSTIGEVLGNHCHCLRQCRVVPFRETIEAVREQIEIECFCSGDLALAEEIAIIIAEVMRLNPKSEIKINGNTLPVEIAQEVYCRLKGEHIENVIRKFSEIKYEIKHIKSYIRTLLYNSVLEYEAKAENDYLKGT